MSEVWRGNAKNGEQNSASSLTQKSKLGTKAQGSVLHRLGERGEGKRLQRSLKANAQTPLTKRYIIYTWWSMSGTPQQNIRRANLFAGLHSVRRIDRTAVTVGSVAATSPHPVTMSSGFVDPFSYSASLINCVSVFGIELNC